MLTLNCAAEKSPDGTPVIVQVQAPLLLPTCDVETAAKLLNVHEKSVLELIDQCVLPAGKAGRGYVLMTRDVLAHAERLIIDQTAARMRRRAPAANDEPVASGGPITTRRRRRPAAR